jgi:glycosyl transferase family 25
MKLFVINLKKSKDRFQNISKNLKSLNIPFERFDAIYGQELFEDEIKENTTFIGRNFLCNRGIIGCAMSHIELWKSFKKSDNDFILISEDDIEYKKGFSKIFKDVDKIYKKVNFDILSLNCSILLKEQIGESISVDDYEITKPLFPLTTASYIVSKKGVKKLLKKFKKINYHIDNQIAWNTLYSDIEYYNIKSPILLKVSRAFESNIIVKNGGILNSLLINIGFVDLNWFISNTAFTLCLDNSISVYACILFTCMVILLIYKKYEIFLLLLVEFILVIY